MAEIDPYLAMGPLHAAAGESPAPAAPAAAPEDTEEVVDDDFDFSLPDGAPEGDEAEPDGPEGEAERPDLDEEDERIAWLIERARKAEEYEREIARKQAEGREAEAVRYWDDRLEKANDWFAGREADIYAKAEQSLNPIGYLREELSKLNSEAQSWYAEYRDNRELALWEFAQEQALPQHAARVVEHYKLPKEAINELLDYPPDQMEREAQRMRTRLIKERKQQKEIDQLKRKAARLEQERNPLNTGAGRGSASAGGEFKPGSDQHYFAMPWTRGR